MLNTSKSTYSSKNGNQLSIIDFRNAKYQGWISGTDRLPEGMGILLDENYQLILGFWKNGSLEGQSLTIFSDGTVFYGSIKNKQPTGMGCYLMPNKMTIYSFINNSSEDIFIIDENGTNLLTVMRGNRRAIKQLIDRKQDNDYLQLELQRKKLLNNKNIEVLKQIPYANFEQKWELIQKSANTAIKVQCKDYKTYLKYYFNSNVHLKQSKIEIVQTKQELQFGFRQTSINCRIVDDSHSHNVFKIKSIGFFDQNLQKMEIYKKHNHTVRGNFQEYCEDNTQIYNERPISCLVSLKKYYKKSLGFTNKFIQTGYLQTIKDILKEISNYACEQISTKQAQILLEKGSISIERPAKKNQKEQSPSPLKEKWKNKDIEKIKLEVYNKLNKKRNSRDNSSVSFSQFLNLSPERKNKISKNYEQSPLRQSKQNNKNDFVSKKRVKKYLQETPKSFKQHQKSIAENAPYYINDKDSQINYSPGSSYKKTYKYLPNERVENTYEKYGEILNQYSPKDKINARNNQPQKYKNTNQYQYLEGDRKVSTQKYRFNIASQEPYRFPQQNQTPFNDQSIKTLTYKYQKIKHQIAENKQSSSRKNLIREASPNPSQRKRYENTPSRYTYLQPSLTHSPSTPSKRQKNNWR